MNCLDIALKDEALLKEVVALKKVFFYTGSANYEHCLQGGLVLTPEQELLERIAGDYEDMRDMNLVAGGPPGFDEIHKTIHGIQCAVNNHFG